MGDFYSVTIIKGLTIIDSVCLDKMILPWLEYKALKQQMCHWALLYDRVMDFNPLNYNVHSNNLGFTLNELKM